MFVAVSHLHIFLHNNAQCRHSLGAWGLGEISAAQKLQLLLPGVNFLYRIQINPLFSPKLSLKITFYNQKNDNVFVTG